LYTKGFFIQVGEDLLYDHRVLDAGDHFDGATAFTARFDINLNHTPSSKAGVEAFVPWQPGTGCMRFNGQSCSMAASRPEVFRQAIFSVEN
jgi:hypothetical protein